MACVARAARGSFVTILQFLLIRNAAEELNKFHYNYVDLYFNIQADRGVRPYILFYEQFKFV